MSVERHPGLRAPAVPTWKPVMRGVTPKATIDDRQPNVVQVVLDVYPAPPQEWEEYFTHWAQMNGVIANLGPGYRNMSSVLLQCSPDSMEIMVGEVDKAIEAANNQYEHHVLPVLEAKAAAEQTSEQQRRDRQKELDERVKYLTRPIPRDA